MGAYTQMQTEPRSHGLNGPFWNSSGGRNSMRKLLFDQNIKKLRGTHSLESLQPLAALHRSDWFTEGLATKTDLRCWKLNASIHISAIVFPHLIVPVSFCRFPKLMWQRDIVYSTKSLADLPVAVVSIIKTALLSGHLIIIFSITVKIKSTNKWVFYFTYLL